MATRRNTRDQGLANIRIAEKHDNIANLLSSAKKAADRNHFAAEANVGVFELILHSYELAASIGFALQTATPEDAMDMGNARKIKEEQVLNSETGKRLAMLAGLLCQDITPEEFDADLNDEQRLDQQIVELSKSPEEDRSCWKRRFRILDRYAYAGFEWLESRKEEFITMEDLVFKVIDEIHPLEFSAIGESPIASVFDN